jgi:hypothetical protein
VCPRSQTVADAFRERALVKAGGADQSQVKAIAVPFDDVERMRDDLGRKKQNRGVPARQVVGALAVDVLGGI